MHPLLELFLMLLGFLASWTLTVLAVALGSWPLYTVPFIGSALLAWLVVRKRKPHGSEIEDKDFSRSGDALEWLVREVKDQE